MNIPQALFLGFIQGLTEFLPISSSGHLVILQHYIGFKEPMLFFDILLHAGTLTAVVFFFRKDVTLVFLSLIKFKQVELQKQRQLVLTLILSMIPTGVMGIVLQRQKDILFQGAVFPAGMLLFTGVFLWLGEKVNPASGGKERVGITDALLIGFMQAVAILPGVSRSGVTISSGLMRGLKREVSFEYSFLLFIPAVLGALILEGKDLSFSSVPPLLPSLAGFLTAFLVGTLALKVLKEVLKEKKLVIFSLYCWAIGGGILLWEGIKLISA